MYTACDIALLQCLVDPSWLLASGLSTRPLGSTALWFVLNLLPPEL